MSRTPARGHEPDIAVGLVDGRSEVRFRLQGAFSAPEGDSWPEGDYRARAAEDRIQVEGPRSATVDALVLAPESSDRARFNVETTIGIDFHWQQQEEQAFGGALRLERGPGGLVVINDVALEAYLTSVICSEMNAASPPALLRAHAIISRSWLLAQLAPPQGQPAVDDPPGVRIRWYDREAHEAFDVCADDHCQRYQGLDRVASAEVAAAVDTTRGVVLTAAGSVCDARFSKCCGGITEDFRAAWQDQEIPYLVPVVDAPTSTLPSPPLTDEAAMRAFVESPPDSYCRCTDHAVLDTVLPSYDRSTADFFRWRVHLTAERATELVAEKAGVDLGRIVALEPVERGLSGRLIRLRLRGERDSLVVGKELEIRRLLSESHLYSSAFVVDVEGDPERPTSFALRGAGWGHGVGLCQIGAAVLAAQGTAHEQILGHYYPGATLERWYP